MIIVKRVHFVVFFLALFISISSRAQDKEVEIKSIVFEGNKRTKMSLIRRELSFKEGDTRLLAAFKEQLKVDEKNVFNLGLFNNVKIEMHEINTTEVLIVVRVEERWYWVAAPIFKLVDRNFNDWWVVRNRDLSRVNYGAMFSHDNVRGKGEKLEFVYRTGFTRRLLVRYRFPYIDKQQRVGLRLSARHSNNKNSTYASEDHVQQFLKSEESLSRQTSIDATISHRTSFYVSNELAFGYKDNSVNDTVLSLNSNFLGFENDTTRTRQRFFSLGYVFRWDRRDVRNYPLKGHDFNFFAYQRGLGIYRDQNAFLINTYFGNFSDLGKKFYASNSIRVLIGGPDDQAYNGYTSLGFGRSLVRGYELVVIEGSDFYLSKNELKKRVFREKFNLGKAMPIEQFRKVPLDIYIKAFFDMGYVNKYENYPNNDRLTNKAIYSLGLGLDVVTYYDFVLRLEYSYNAENQFNFFVNFKSAL